MTRPHEGATLDGLHVLTDAELNRTIKHALFELQTREKQRQLDKRRAAWRRNSARRYARYRQLIDKEGLDHRWWDWSGHLAELEGRCRPPKSAEVNQTKTGRCAGETAQKFADHGIRGDAGAQVRETT